MSCSSQLFARVVLGSCLSVVPLGMTWSAERPAAVVPGSEVLTYTTASGESFVAFGLRAKDLPEVKSMRHHVVLLDTSASQFGEHRTQGFAVLESFLNALPNDDQVMLFAVDVQATRMTPEFVPPNSNAVRDALTRLRQRAPLGATNLEAALRAAATALPKESLGTVLYLGDGMSSVNLLTSETLRQSLSELRERHVPVSSYAVGPRRDLKVLGVLAQHTGGVVVVDEGREPRSPSSDPNAAGRQLATSATASVFYPDQLEVAGSDLKLASADPLPLRADRETYVLAQGQFANDSSLTVSGRFADRDVRWQWSVQELRGQNASPFVAAAFRQAAKDGGFVPYAGRELLTAAWNEFDQRIELLTAEAAAAQSRRQSRDAERIARALQDLDPENAQAKLLLGLQPTLKVKPVSRQLAQAEQAEKPAGDSLLNRDEFQRDPAGSRNLLDDEIARQQIIGEKLQLEVSRAIQEARSIAGTDPDNAITILKRAYGAVKSTIDARIDLRQQLGRQLQSVIADVRAQKEVAEQKQIHLQERVAVVEAEKRLQEKLKLEDEKLENLIDRVRALLHDAERGNDAAYVEAEAAAEAAQQLKPNSGVSAAARFDTEASFQLNMAFRLRNLRADKLLKTLEQVELSHVPFPDEPPVLFPAPEVWKALSERRKQYASVDLHKASKAEERIAAALDEQTEIAFTDTPLTDVVTFLSDYHQIPIIIDKEALAEEGIAEDSPVTRQLAGVKLRSALKIILQPLQLSYVIEDEVMKITTAAKEKERLQTRVYPVGDLVVILQPGGGLGGLGGGFGGQQGGFGGQQGGFGGGGFGGQQGGFGGGGGFFNIPVNMPNRQANPEAPAFNNQKVNDSKKKAHRDAVIPIAFLEPPKSVKSRPERASEANSPALFSTLLQNRKSTSASVQLPKLDAGSPREVWQRYFADQKPSPQAVAQIVRQLHQTQQYEHTIACIEVALIEQPPQPWMYEVLGASMELAKRPKADVERVMLSRVDFTAAIVPEMMLSAAYLKQLGLNERALALYQQASRLAPTRPEPYLRGLQIARELNDAKGVEWGAAGVLTNVWLSGYQAHHREAEGIAANVEEALRKAGRDSEADSLRAAVAAARQRDLMLRLSWTGDADLDLSVEEPNGGICSFENPFTTAGGAYTHDGYGPKTANCFEEYIAASALPGDYLVRVRLIDGEVVGRRATLTIRRYVGTPEESTKTMTVPIDGKDKVVRLSLNEGRRTTLLERAPENDPAVDVARNPASAPMSATSSRQFATGGNVVSGGGGAIGFQPVITTIPEGIGFSAIAVVTGDRRYVRLSVAPMFSQIIGVDKFIIPSGR